MKENNLGSISSIVKPLSGHANFDENVNFSVFLNLANGLVFVEYEDETYQKNIEK